MAILSNQKQWIKACEQTLQEYKDNCHVYTMSKCKLCNLMKKNKTNCIFGYCKETHTGLCAKHKTFRCHKGDGTKQQKRIRFYEILIPILKSLNKKDFHKRSKFHKITKICQEIDELVHQAFKAKNKQQNTCGTV